MAQGNSNSTMEMGTSDQVLVTSSKKKSLTYILGGVAMVVAIGVVITLVVLLSGNEGGSADELVNPTTEGTTTIVTSSTPVTEATTTTTTTTTAPEPDENIDLEDIINGEFLASTFNASWISGTELLFRNANEELVLYNVDTETSTVLVSNTSQILQQSSRVSSLSPDRTQIVLAYNTVPVYRHSFLARYAAIEISTGAVTDIAPPNVNSTEVYLQNFVWGTSGTAFAFVYLNNIYYQESINSAPIQITTSGVLNVIYHGIPDWVYEEEVFVSKNAIYFSNDGSKMAFASFDDTNVRVMRVPHYGVPGSVDYQYTQHHEIRYPKPGTTNPTASVTLRDLETGSTTVYTPPTDLVEPILTTVRFATNDTVATAWTNRVQNQLRVLICSQEQTTCNQIFEYAEPEGWIDPIVMIFNEEGNSFLTILPQSVDGVRYKQVVQISENIGSLWTTRDRTNTPHTVAEIMKWTENDVIWYKATGVNDSAERHIYSVDASGVVTCFTCNIQKSNGEECLYNDGTISSDATRVTVGCSGPGVPETFIYDVNGTLLSVWEDNAAISSLTSSKVMPQTIRLSVPVADGFPDADVHIEVPADYQQRTNVPLLVYVYGGPDTALVTKQWGIDWGTSLVSRWNVAVAHIDARGSGLKGVANAFAINRRLGTYEIEDTINVTRYLQESLPWVDANRTCVWGWSYGGYTSSLALARGGDVFRCAIAVAPVVDWRFYDSIYTERYMDVPQNNTQGYSASSLLTEEVVEAYRQKRYFLIHGTADDNVHYQHSMLISRLLQRRDVYFHQMSYTDEDHGLPGVWPHLYHSIEKFLLENML